MDKFKFDVVAQNLARTEGMVAQFVVDAHKPFSDSGYRPGDVLQYSITGLDQNDIEGGVLGASVVLGQDLRAVINVPLRIDGVQEGTETLFLTVFDDSFSVTNQMAINDGAWISPANRFDVVAKNLSVMEGMTATFLINAESPHHEVVYKPGDEMFYTVSGVAADDLVSGQLTGSVILNSQREALIDIAIRNDRISEENETLIVTVFGDGYSSSNQVQIVDADYVDAPPEGGVVMGTDALDVIYTEFTVNQIDVEFDGQEVTVSAQQAGGELVQYQLVGVERLRLEDAFLALDIDGIAGQAYRIYQAAFDRQPDADGLGYWIYQLDSNLSLSAVAASFVASEEFLTNYGPDVSDAEFVRLLYANVLDREPDLGGFTYWTESMQNDLTREQVLASFSESPENKGKVASQVEEGIFYSAFLG